MLFYIIILLLFIGIHSSLEEQTTLRQIHVIFRHGDRTPDQNGLYPTDPYINDTWYPEGLGQLTLYGKMQEYKIGKALRKRYDQFLGNIYTTEVIEPVSTDYNRTKMSLQLVLTGLYPPAPSQIWNNLLPPWQPIPYNYVSWETDSVMRFALIYCPIYQKLYNEVYKEEVFQSFIRDNSDLIEYVSENTGLPMNSFRDLFGIWVTLNAEVQTGRVIPEWTKKVFPDFLGQVGNLFYEQMTYNNVLKKYSGGIMLKKIVADARAKKIGILFPKGRKIFLYSGHEYNMAYILGALNVFKPHIPPYGSYVIIELHKIKEIYGFKILYQDYTYSIPQYLTVPGCDEFCPFDKFVNLLNDNMPDDTETC